MRAAAVLALALALALALNAAAAQPTLLSVDDREAPVLGVESRSPIFRWAAPAGQAVQSAFQVRVYAAVTGALVWDSSEVQSSEQRVALAPQPSAPLLPGTQYLFQVRTWDGSGSPSPYSVNASFVTGLWEGGWEASPIWHPNASAGFVFFRASVPLPLPSAAAAPALVSAYAFVTANPQASSHGEHENSKLLAAYKLFLGGSLVGMGPGRVGTCGPVCPVGGDKGVCVCSPHHVYDVYDVTQLVSPSVSGGGNLTVAVQSFNYPPNNGSSPILTVPSKVLLQLTLTFDDGSVLVLGAGPGTAAASSASTFVSLPFSALNADPYFSPSCCVSDVAWYLQPAENFVAALEPVGWRGPGYEPSPPDPRWVPAALQPPFDPAKEPLVARPTRPLVVAEGVQPASVLQLGPAHWFVDFGQEFQGGVRISFPSDDPSYAGQTVQIRMGEELLSSDPPAVKYQMRTGNTFLYTWTLRGPGQNASSGGASGGPSGGSAGGDGGVQFFELHEYIEFRYMEIVGNPPPEQCALTAPADYTTPVALACAQRGQTISAVSFASWGTPSGQCVENGPTPDANTFAVNTSCAAADSVAVVKGLCVGKAACSFVPSDALFGGQDPCDKVEKWLAVAVQCTAAAEEGEAEAPVRAPFPSPVSISAWVLTYPAAYVQTVPVGRRGAGEARVPRSLGLPLPAAVAPPQASSVQVSTSSPTLDSVWSLCQYTVVATALDMFTDSNTRQRSVICSEALHINILMQFATSTEVALQNYTLAYTLNERPYAMGWAEWQALTIFSVFQLYAHTGDLSVFASLYDHLRVFTELSLVNSTTGLWTCDGVSFDCIQPEIDWPSGMRDGFVFRPADTVVNSYTYRAILLFAAMAADLGGHDDDVVALLADAASLRAAINAQLWNSTSGAYVDGAGTEHTAWHSSLYAVAFGVPTEREYAAALAYVANRSVGDPAVCQPGNVYPAQWALEAFYGGTDADGVLASALARFGWAGGVGNGTRDDHGFMALALLLCNGTNSWVAMLQQNCTTTAEAWHPEEKPNETFSHSWAASPADILPRFLLGVRPMRPGFKKLIVQPQLGSLAWAQGTVPTVRGPVVVAVNQTLAVGGGESRQLVTGPGQGAAVASVSVSVSVPGNTEARVCLPAAPCGGSVVLDGTSVTAFEVGDYACVEGVLAGPHTATCG